MKTPRIITLITITLIAPACGPDKKDAWVLNDKGISIYHEDKKIEIPVGENVQVLYEGKEMQNLPKKTQIRYKTYEGEVNGHDLSLVEGRFVYTKTLVPLSIFDNVYIPQSSRVYLVPQADINAGMPAYTEIILLRTLLANYSTPASSAPYSNIFSAKRKMISGCSCLPVNPCGLQL